MRRAGLSKSKLLSFLQCPRRLWLEAHRPDLITVDLADDPRIKTGHRVGELARGLLAPGGILIEAPSLRAAAEATRTHLRREGSVVYEATFIYDGVVVRADIVRATRGGLDVIEVKSSTSVKDYHLTDTAIQRWVIERSGYRVAGVAVAHVDNTFVYPGGGDYAGLLTVSDVTADIALFDQAVSEWIAAARRTLRGGEPAITTGPHCASPFDCPFRAHCYGEEEHPEYPVTILPRGGRVVAELLEEGLEDLRALPRERLSSPKHLRIWEATRSGRPFLDPAAVAQVKALAYPRYYLDFETVGFAVPIWAGTRPYQPLPFQWSCHVERAPGALTHHEFLDVSGEPPMRALAEALVATLGDAGPILAYSHFEATQIRQLASLFPDLAAPLTALCPRIVDLLRLAEAYYYHPQQRGSWSIKAVLPTVAPDLRYDDLAVADGSAAQDAYQEAISPATDPATRERIAQDLKAYCGRDSLALVRLVDFFAGAGG